MPLDSQILPKIKVCGLTRAKDALIAYQAGADALGVISASQSPRTVTAKEAQKILADIPQGIKKVAVFVNQKPKEAVAFCKQSHCNTVQLCGDEKPTDWFNFPLPILKRISVNKQALETSLRWKDLAWGFILDHPSSPGGTGKTVDLDLAKIIASEYPCLIAGGIRPANVKRIIQQVNPLGVDSSSGIEKDSGIKDKSKMIEYIHNARVALKTKKQ